MVIIFKALTSIAIILQIVDIHILPFIQKDKKLLWALNELLHLRWTYNRNLEKSAFSSRKLHTQQRTRSIPNLTYPKWIASSALASFLQYPVLPTFLTNYQLQYCVPQGPLHLQKGQLIIVKPAGTPSITANPRIFRKCDPAARNAFLSFMWIIYVRSRPAVGSPWAMAPTACFNFIMKLKLWSSV